jgi:TetR/AcrR family transcriptional repressor of uid operon
VTVEAHSDRHTYREVLAGTDETGRRIVRAAVACFAAHGARRATMNQIADRAGLGVATVYRRFPRKAELVRTVVLHEAAVLIDEVDRAVGPDRNVEDRVVEGFAAFTLGMAARPVLQQVLTADSEIARYLGGSAGHGHVVRLVRDYLTRSLSDVIEAEPDEAELIADIYTRLAVSLVIAPDGVIPLGDELATRDFAERFLVRLLPWHAR